MNDAEPHLLWAYRSWEASLGYGQSDSPQVNLNRLYRVCLPTMLPYIMLCQNGILHMA